MTAAEFAREYREEDAYVEFKASTANIAEPAVAFSNSDGGVVLLGVNDDGSIRGLRLTGAVEAEIHSKLRDGTVNIGRYSIGELLVDDRKVTIVTVARRVEGFSQMRNGRVLLRQGASNTSPLGDELATFVTARSSTSYESTSTEVPASDASEDLLLELQEAWGWTTRTLGDRLLDEGLRTSDDHLTVGGALLLLEDPAEVVGKAIIEILRYDDDSDRYTHRATISGPAQRQIESATLQVSEALGSDLVVLGARRREVPRIPMEVIREAVANAVAHRSYELGRSKIIIRIRPSRVEVVSPGALPEPVTVENIREQTSARNPVLMNSLRRLGLAEDIGRGVDVMQDRMAEALLDPPHFEASETSVAVTLRTSGQMLPEERAWVAEIETRGALQPGDRMLLALAARGETLTNSTVRSALGLDSTAARAALRRLRDAGLLEQLGDRGGAQYRLSSSLGRAVSHALDPAHARDIVLELAKSEGKVTNAMVRLSTGLERHQAVSLLKGLVAEGKLGARGARRGSHYVPVE